MYQLTPDELGDVRAGSFSTHGIALDQTIRLGAVLDRLPHRMIVLAVEVADLGGWPRALTRGGPSCRHGGVGGAVGDQ
ncbi:hypothetical protein QM693_24025 [Rhodococcus sp. IEGM 1305]|nr:hypothetical protein [Rhodococcus sp. IEGM 1305]MDI9952208.1 hypothetical protein [Rhodococcus sp. IEGM 1305]